MNKQDLGRFYVEEGLTDQDIANKLNIDRTAIVHTRKKRG
jgi:DNA-binding transcriptional regulator LsrR (DeoR family)